LTWWPAHVSHRSLQAVRLLAVGVPVVVLGRLRPGVFTLGEIGFVDDDGYVYITDRFSDMIVSGGVNIYPAEAEQVINDHSQVADVAVIGVPNAEMGEEAKGLVGPVDPK